MSATCAAVLAGVGGVATLGSVVAFALMGNDAAIAALVVAAVFTAATGACALFCPRDRPEPRGSSPWSAAPLRPAPVDVEAPPPPRREPPAPRHEPTSPDEALKPPPSREAPYALPPSSSSPQNECAICLEPIRQEDAVALACGHCFHAACRDGLVRRECPLCRTPI